MILTTYRRNSHIFTGNLGKIKLREFMEGVLSLFSQLQIHLQAHAYRVDILVTVNRLSVR